MASGGSSFHSSAVSQRFAQNLMKFCVGSSFPTYTYIHAMQCPLLFRLQHDDVGVRTVGGSASKDMEPVIYILMVGLPASCLVHSIIEMIPSSAVEGRGFCK